MENVSWKGGLKLLPNVWFVMGRPGSPSPVWKGEGGEKEQEC